MQNLGVLFFPQPEGVCGSPRVQSLVVIVSFLGEEPSGLMGQFTNTVQYSTVNLIQNDHCLSVRFECGRAEFRYEKLV